MKKILFFVLACLGAAACTPEVKPADEVNPYMGAISHLLVPTYPTVHLPNAMMRVYPNRPDFTTDYLNGLPLIVPDHRKGSVVNFTAYTGDETEIRKNPNLNYDNERITPYRYHVLLDDEGIVVDFAPSAQSAVYRLQNESGETMSLLFSSKKGKFEAHENRVKAEHYIHNSPHKVYLFMEFDQMPAMVQNLSEHASVVRFAPESKEVTFRYGVSFISVEQAEANLKREIKDFDLDRLAQKAARIWNETLSKVKIQGGTPAERSVFYTSLYRTYERPICISEDGRYYDAFSKTVKSDEGRAFYVDDWLWDTYRATHPLRILIENDLEADILNSYVRMAGNMPEGRQWLPTFPKIVGDSRGMNCNHGIISIYDAWVKGCRNFDLEAAYQVSKAAIEEKTLIPWSGAPAGVLDDFYKEHGYFPSLAYGEKETVEQVVPHEKRQPVPVTLGTSYDHWALSGMARELGKKEDAEKYHACALNYRNIFNPETRFFHPKDSQGNFVTPLDYCIGGGMGGREYYDENNAYTYRWDVQHNIADLVRLQGGAEQFCAELDKLFKTPLGMGKAKFYNLFGGNQTGNVGQFGMGNEPSFHIPYLYIYGGQPWKTQKRVKSLLNMWYRNDLMGVPGDEDGGGMSAFVLMSQIGIYPVTPGTPVYCITSPAFDESSICLSSGKTFTVKATGLSAENKYIQSAELNGKPYANAWLLHEDLINGGVLELVMGPRPCKEWGTVPPPDYF